MSKKIRVRLTCDEYNTLNSITRKTKTDCWFCLDVDKEGFDCVKDLESGRKITLRTAVKWLTESVSWMTTDDWNDVGVSTKEITTFHNLVTKLEI